MANSYYPSFINSTTGDPSNFHLDTEWFTKQDLNLFIDSLETLSRLERKRHERQRKRKTPILDFIEKIRNLTLDDDVDEAVVDEPPKQYSEQCCFLRTTTTKVATDRDQKGREFVTKEEELEEVLITMEQKEYLKVGGIHQRYPVINHNKVNVSANGDMLCTLECSETAFAVPPAQNYDEETYFSAPGSALNSPRNSKTFDIAAEPKDACRGLASDDFNEDKSESEESGVFPNPREESGKIKNNDNHHHHQHFNGSITSTVTTRSLFNKMASSKSKKDRRSMRSRLVGLVTRHKYLSWRRGLGDKEEKLRRKKEKKLRRREEKFLKMEEKRKQRHERLIDDLLRQSMTSLATKSSGRKSLGAAADKFLNKAMRYMTL